MEEDITSKTIPIESSIGGSLLVGSLSTPGVVFDESAEEKKEEQENEAQNNRPDHLVNLLRRIHR